jgi:hypothetical protein
MAPTCQATWSWGAEHALLRDIYVGASDAEVRNPEVRRLSRERRSRVERGRGDCAESCATNGDPPAHARALLNGLGETHQRVGEFVRGIC